MTRFAVITRLTQNRPQDSPWAASGLRGEKHTTQTSAEAEGQERRQWFASPADDRSSAAAQLTSRSPAAIDAKGIPLISPG